VAAGDTWGQSLGQRREQMMEGKSTLAMLFDLSFTEFVTPKIIRVFYMLGVLFSAIFALFVIIAGFKVSAILGILLLILSPIVFFIYVLLARMYCELIVVAFRIAENTSRLVEQGKSQ
jgi:hypothetical protein